MQLFFIEMRTSEEEAAVEDIRSQILEILILSYMLNIQTENDIMQTSYLMYTVGVQ